MFFSFLPHFGFIWHCLSAWIGLYVIFHGFSGLFSSCWSLILPIIIALSPWPLLLLIQPAHYPFHESHACILPPTHPTNQPPPSLYLSIFLFFRRPNLDPIVTDWSGFAMEVVPSRSSSMSLPRQLPSRQSPVDVSGELEWRDHGGGLLRPVAVQVVEVHYPTRCGGGTAERLQLGPASKAPATPLVSVFSVITAAVQDWFNPWLQQPEQGTRECAWVADLERGWWGVGFRWRRRWG